VARMDCAPCVAGKTCLAVLMATARNGMSAWRRRPAPPVGISMRMAARAGNAWDGSRFSMGNASIHLRLTLTLRAHCVRLRRRVAAARAAGIGATGMQPTRKGILRSVRPSPGKRCERDAYQVRTRIISTSYHSQGLLRFRFTGDACLLFSHFQLRGGRCLCKVAAGST
jgi:hypothetical protein